MENLIKWSPLVFTVITASIAIGAGQQRLSTVEDVQVSQGQQIQTFTTVKEDVAAGNARQEIILDQLKEQRAEQREFMQQILIRLGQ